MQISHFQPARVVPMLVALLFALGIAVELRPAKGSAQATNEIQAPMFEVDPFWPKPLPNHWVLGRTIGVSVDAHDHVWITHRVGTLEDNEKHATTNPPTAECCVPAPPVLEFEQAGVKANARQRRERKIITTNTALTRRRLERVSRI